MEPDDTVVEIWPGGGWYTNILAPWLASGGGQLVEVLFDPAGIDDAARVARINSNNDSFKSNYTDAKFGTIAYSGFSANSGPLAEPGSVDASSLSETSTTGWRAATSRNSSMTPMPR